MTRRKRKKNVQQKNAIKLRNTCQVWTIFQSFCEFFIFHPKEVSDTFTHRVHLVHWNWVIPERCSPSRFYIAFKSFFTISQLKSSLWCSPFKLMKHLVRRHVFFLLKCTLITLHRIALSRSASKKAMFLVIILRRTWINLIKFFYLLCSARSSKETRRNGFLLSKKCSFESIHVYILMSWDEPGWVVDGQNHLLMDRKLISIRDISFLTFQF